jgi:DNA-binding MarR family transcriptional regulator
MRTDLGLERLATLLQATLRDSAARHGLLPVQLQALTYLARANRYSDIPAAVAEYLGITRGTVSQTLGVLERKGLVTKQGDEHHGRLVHLVLTETGRAVVDDAWSTRWRRVLGAPAAGELPGLAALLQSLQQLNGNQAFGVCRECAHFQPRGGTGGGGHCNLTGEPLAAPQVVKICREWKAPAGA